LPRNGNRARCICCGESTPERYRTHALCPECRRKYVEEMGPIELHTDRNDQGADPETVAIWRRWWSNRDKRQRLWPSEEEGSSGAP
jgi:hypothetical protein